MDTGTATMSGFGHQAGTKTDAAACLVLLYADQWRSIPAAIPIGDGLVLGREPPPGGLRLDASGVSRLHARIERRSDRLRIVDLDSKNGLVINGRVVREADLKDLDEVRVGDVVFKFVLAPAEPYAAQPFEGVEGREIVGGHQMQTVAAEIARAAKTALTLLVLGETGTGKEVIAQAAHRWSGRSGPFVALNCAAIPANLVESELFGFRKGAFTGADRHHSGVVRAANGGTLMLDEIGDMPLEVQAKLLRLLEAREVVPLGGTTAEKVDVRVVCATHRDLRSLVAEGRFRGDLFARIQGYTTALPPLRSRKEDLYQLVRHFLRRAQRSDVRLSFRFMLALTHYTWPFNVRELASTIERAVMIADGSLLEEAHLPDALREVMRDYGGGAAPLPAPPARASGPPGEAALREALARASGNVSEVARMFGKDRTQINRWLRLYGIAVDEYRSG